MGQAKLEISSDLSALIAKVDQLDASVKRLTGETDQYNQRSTAGFNKTSQAADQAGRSVTSASTAASKATQVFKILATTMGAVFSVGLILAWGKTIISSTGAGADAMERFKEGTARAMQTLNTALATANFENLIQGLRDAYTEGKRYADVLDEIKARQAALGAFKATLETQQAEQRLIARNASNSVEVRQAAIDKIIELEKQKLTETLSLQNTELDEALKASAIRTGISAKDEEQLKARKLLVEEWARAYGTVEGVNKLNEDLAKAVELEARLDKLIKVSIDDRGRMNKDTRAYNVALANLTDEEKKLLGLKEINTIVRDEERDRINKLMETRSNSVTQSIEQEVALQRLKNTLLNELMGLKDKEAKADKERVKTTLEENLESLDKYIDEVNKKTFDINLGFGGQQTAEDFQKQIDENLKGFDLTMDLNPQFSTDSSAEAQAWDDAYKLMEDNLAEFEKIQQETWANMQKFAEDHPLAEAMGFENEEQLEQAKEYVGQLLDFANQIVDDQVKASERIVEDQNQRIDEQQALVDNEMELKAEGLANSYELEKENLKKMQKARDEAIKDRERMIKIQRIMSTTESGIALVSAAANIIKGFSSIPVVGVVLGLAAVAAMIAGFLLMSSKAKDATKMERGGLLEGKRHTQGGIPMEAEGGEFFINRKSTAKHLPLLEAINRDDREGMRLYFDRKFINKFHTERNERDYTKHLKNIERNTRNKNSETIYGNGFIIERIGGYTKKINLN